MRDEEGLLRRFIAQPKDAGEWSSLRLYWEKLHQHLSALNIDGGIALAYSGGMDSLVLLQLCLEAKLEVLALHFAGPQFASSHTHEAVKWLQEHDVPHKIVDYHALAIPEVRRSDTRRCYFCKKHLLSTLRREAGGRILCDGTNATDFKGYRPGLEALREAGVYSPFASVMLTKPQIRRMAQILGMDLPVSTGQSCLLTRFEYGLPVGEHQLSTIEKVEAEVLPLLSTFNSDGSLQSCLQFRLRYLIDMSAPQGARAELHIESAMPLPQSLEDKLGAVLAANGLSGAGIKVMPKVSGFFDINDTSLDYCGD